MISVAICTWNRAQLLDQTLDHLTRVRIPEGAEWEVLVVNNNCTDNTDRVLEKHFSHLPLRRPLGVQARTFARAKLCHGGSSGRSGRLDG